MVGPGQSPGPTALHIQAKGWLGWDFVPAHTGFATGWLYVLRYPLGFSLGAHSVPLPSPGRRPQQKPSLPCGSCAAALVAVGAWSQGVVAAACLCPLLLLLRAAARPRPCSCCCRLPWGPGAVCCAQTLLFH